MVSDVNYFLADFDVSVDNGATVINSTWQHVRVIDKQIKYNISKPLFVFTTIMIVIQCSQPSQFLYSGTDDNGLLKKKI